MERIGKVEFDMGMRGLAEEGLVLPADHPHARRIIHVANRIIMANEELRNKKWTVTVIADPTKNAMVLPSGNIFVHIGMVDICDNDDQECNPIHLKSVAWQKYFLFLYIERVNVRSLGTVISMLYMY